MSRTTETDPPLYPSAAVTHAAAETGASDEAGIKPARSPWRRAVATALGVWGAAGLAYLLTNCMVWAIRSEAGPTLAGMLEVWDRWDTGHYVAIAMKGYDPQNESAAFFPFYPLLIRIFEPVLPGGGLAAALIVANVACIVALAFLHRLVEDLTDAVTARRTVFYLMVFPYAFFLCSAHNESVFLAFTLASLYCMRRGQWWVAGALGAFASATRQAGLLLGLAFVVEYMRQRRWRISGVRGDVLGVALIPFGTGAYALYCWHAFGDPLRFAHLQVLWGREPSWPWEGPMRALSIIREAAVDGAIFQPTIVFNVLDLAAVVAMVVLLVLSVVGPWRLNAESAYVVTFGFAGFLLVLVSPIGLGVPLHGAPRYALEVIPAFIVLARMCVRPTAERFYVMPAMALQALLLLAMFFGHWLA